MPYPVLVLAALLLTLSGDPRVSGADLPSVPTHEIAEPGATQPKIIGLPIAHPRSPNQPPEKESWSEHLWTDPTATFTMAVAIFTLCLVIVSAYQGKQLSRTASIAARAAEDA